jgi:hypothetical protein
MCLLIYLYVSSNVSMQEKLRNSANMLPVNKEDVDSKVKR